MASTTAVDTLTSTDTEADPKTDHVYPLFETIDRLMTPSNIGPNYLEVTFQVYWDVDGYFEEEIEQPVFPSVLTLSGRMPKAFATTCEDYIKRFWPDLSTDVLEQLLPAVLKLRDPGTNRISAVAQFPFMPRQL